MLAARSGRTVVVLNTKTYEHSEDGWERGKMQGQQCYNATPARTKNTTGIGLTGVTERVTNREVRAIRTPDAGKGGCASVVRCIKPVG